MRDVMHDFTLPTFRDYAARWGYQVWDRDDTNYHWARPGRGMGMTPAARRRHMAEYNAPVHPGFAAVR